MSRTKKTLVVMLAMVLVAGAASFATAVVFSTTISGKSVAVARSIRSSTLQSFTDDGGATSPVNLGGASTAIKVPAGQKAILLIRFAGDTGCYGGISDGQDGCYARVLVNGKVVPPGEVSFDNNGGNTESFLVTLNDAHSMDWSYGPVGGGSYTVRVQVRVDESPCCLVTFDVSHWTLTVERVTAA